MADQNHLTGAAEPTPEMIDAALNAWFASPPSETDQGLERSMKAALIAARLITTPAQAALTQEDVYANCWATLIGFSNELTERDRKFICDQIARKVILAAQPPDAPVETDRQKLLDALPLQFQDGPDYCTVRDARGKDFALTVQPDILKEMESALRVALVASTPVSRSSAGTGEEKFDGDGRMCPTCGRTGNGEG